MPSRPYFKFYPGDFMGDTRRLTAEQRGAYIAILCELWVSDGRLPLDHAELALAAGVSPKRWPSVWAKLGRFFQYEGEPGKPFFIHRKLMELMQEVDQISEERRAASAMGVAAKRLKKQRSRKPNG